MSLVPVPEHYSAKIVLEKLDKLEKAGVISDSDSFEKRLNLLATLFEGIEEPTAEALKLQLKLVREYN